MITNSHEVKLKYYGFPPKLKMWYSEAKSEQNAFHPIWKKFNAAAASICEDYAIYPKRFYKTVAKYSKEKDYDYCFIGALCIDKNTLKNRQWILKFISESFTASSYLQFTDSKTKEGYQELGSFDYTLRRKGLVPKELPRRRRNSFDKEYFKNLSKSKFTLCPAGDSRWSMRFYESLMCKSIPIVSSKNDTFRTKAESMLDYKYYLASDDHIYREDWIEHNYEIFLKYHTL